MIVIAIQQANVITFIIFYILYILFILNVLALMSHEESRGKGYSKIIIVYFILTLNSSVRCDLKFQLKVTFDFIFYTLK